MNKKYIAGLLVVLVIGVVSGYLLRDLPLLRPKQEDLPGELESGEYVGDEILKVKLVKEDGTPLPDFEIDLWAEGKTEGPPTAAIEETDEEGIATFHLKPGTYWQGFNLSNWPEDLETPVGQRKVTVKSGEINSLTITLKSR